MTKKKNLENPGENIDKFVDDSTEKQIQLTEYLIRSLEIFLEKEKDFLNYLKELKDERNS